MQVSMKCSVAVHCLIFIHEAEGVARVTSALLAESTGCNPVVVRTALSSLKKAGIITVERGKGGAHLAMPPEAVTLAMVFDAVDPDGLSDLIKVHDCSDRACPVARNIRGVLEAPYRDVRDAVHRAMEGVTLASLIEDFHRRLAEADAGQGAHTA